MATYLTLATFLGQKGQNIGQNETKINYFFFFEVCIHGCLIITMNGNIHDNI